MNLDAQLEWNWMRRAANDSNYYDIDINEYRDIFGYVQNFKLLDKSNFIENKKH